MGLFLFSDGLALVCGWVNFPILWPHTPVQMKLKCPPGLEAQNRIGSKEDGMLARNSP